MKDDRFSPGRRRMIGLGLGGIAASALSVGRTGASLGAPLSSELDQLLDATAGAYGTVGHSVAILRRGERVYTRHAGLADRDTGARITDRSVYPLFSISKLFVVIELLKAVERRQINLSRPLGAIRADLPDAWRTITLAQAIAHVSGLPDYIPDHIAPTVDQAFAAIHDLPLRFTPGTRNAYTQTNFLFAHEALKQAAGASVAILARAQFRAAGMRQAAYHTDYPNGPVRLPDLVSSYRPVRDRAGPPAPSVLPSWPDYTFGSTGVFATLDEMILWSQALVRGALLPLPSLHASWAPFPLQSGEAAWHTHGWEYYRHGDVTIIGHGGDNRLVWRHFLRTADPHDCATVVYLDNGGRSTFDRHRLAALLADHVMPGAARSGEAEEETLFRALASGQWNRAADRLLAQRSVGTVETIVNRVGYDAMNILDAETAIIPFEWNVRRFPMSANAHDSLGEALRFSGRVALARASYRRALALDPANARIRRILDELAAPAGAN